MRYAVALLLLGGCAPGPAEVDAEHAFVRRSGPTADTLTVGRADTLRARLDAALVVGGARWALVAPSGDTAWAGRIGTADTVAAFEALTPVPGEWRLTLAPDSAVGVVGVRMAAR